MRAASFARLTKFRAFGEQNLLFIAMRENKPTAMLVFDSLTNLYLYKYLYVERNSMAHVSYSELRNNLASYMDEVCNNHAPLFITRQNARSVVMMSEEEYEGLMETVHLLKSPANAARMLRSIQDADQDKLTERELIDPGKVGA